MVKSVIDGVTTYYVGGIYELEVDGEEETERKYYSAGSKRIALARRRRTNLASERPPRLH